MGCGHSVVRHGDCDGRLSDPLSQADGSVSERGGRARTAEPDPACGNQRPSKVMLNCSFDAVVPMVCVTLAALAVMGAESFRSKEEKLPLGGLGVVGLIGAAIASVLLWNRNAYSFGVIVADNFGLF